MQEIHLREVSGFVLLFGDGANARGSPSLSHMLLPALIRDKKKELPFSNLP